MFDWDDLRHFLAVARIGSVRGAAKFLAVEPSTVLRRVGHLELSVQAQLFDRSPAGLKLRGIGKEAYRIASEMEELAAALAERIERRDDR